jgi:hypothetical protein
MQRVSWNSKQGRPDYPSVKGPKCEPLRKSHSTHWIVCVLTRRIVPPFHYFMNLHHGCNEESSLGSTYLLGRSKGSGRADHSSENSSFHHLDILVWICVKGLECHTGDDSQVNLRYFVPTPDFVRRLLIRF